MKHTKGPWRYDPDWCAVWGGDCDVEIVAPNSIQFESDARLIAAAPELLETLQDLWSWVKSWDAEFMDDPEFDRRKYETAIAKATGDTQ